MVEVKDIQFVQLLLEINNQKNSVKNSCSGHQHALQKEVYDRTTHQWQITSRKGCVFLTRSRSSFIPAVHEPHPVHK